MEDTTLLNFGEVRRFLQESVGSVSDSDEVLNAVDLGLLNAALAQVELSTYELEDGHFAVFPYEDEILVGKTVVLVDAEFATEVIIPDSVEFDGTFVDFTFVRAVYPDYGVRLATDENTLVFVLDK